MSLELANSANNRFIIQLWLNKSEEFNCSTIVKPVWNENLVCIKEVHLKLVSILIHKQKNIRHTSLCWPVRTHRDVQGFTIDNTEIAIGIQAFAHCIANLEEVSTLK